MHKNTHWAKLIFGKWSSLLILQWQLSLDQNKVKKWNILKWNIFYSFKPVFNCFFTGKILSVRFFLTHPVYLVDREDNPLHDCPTSLACMAVSWYQCIYLAPLSQLLDPKNSTASIAARVLITSWVWLIMAVRTVPTVLTYWQTAVSRPRGSSSDAPSFGNFEALLSRHLGTTALRLWGRFLRRLRSDLARS